MIDPTRQALAEQLAVAVVEYLTRMVNSDDGFRIISLHVPTSSVEVGLVETVARVLAAHETAHPQELNQARHQIGAAFLTIHALGRDVGLTSCSPWLPEAIEQLAEARCTALAEQLRLAIIDEANTAAENHELEAERDRLRTALADVVWGCYRCRGNGVIVEYAPKYEEKPCPSCGVARTMLASIDAPKLVPPTQGDQTGGPQG